MIDLHCHSHFSDGLLSPQLLLDKAIQAQIKVLALTDHDTVAGLDALHHAALQFPIKIINGIEFSTRWKKYDVHILGLNIDHKHPYLTELITQQNENRIERAIEIGQRLIPFALQNGYEKACALAGHKRAGRPHFAQVLVNEGLASDLQAAFKKYLGRGKPAYVPTPWLSIEQAVAGINEAGGMAVIAHPFKYKLTRTKLHELIKLFKSAGGAGIEVVSGEMKAVEIAELNALCKRFTLFASSGSDYHGDGVSRVSLGKQSALPTSSIPIWDQWGVME